MGWRLGNFAVRDGGGKLLFVAHHHSEDERSEITQPYERLPLRFHDGVSMHGHAVQMFAFIGRKPYCGKGLSDSDPRGAPSDH